MREIKKDEVKLLESRKIIRNSDRGFVDRFGNVVGFYKTKNKRYIEDKYVGIVEKVKKKSNKRIA